MSERRPVTASRQFAVEKLEVFSVALDFMRFVDSLGRRLWRRHAGMFDHLQRATASVISNVGEACSTFRATERLRFYEFAYRSAGECSALVVAYRVLGELTDEENDRARELLHRVQMMLMRLMQRNQPPRPASPPRRPNA